MVYLLQLGWAGWMERACSDPKTGAQPAWPQTWIPRQHGYNHGDPPRRAPKVGVIVAILAKSGRGLQPTLGAGATLGAEGQWVQRT